MRFKNKGKQIQESYEFYIFLTFDMYLSSFNLDLQSISLK